MSWIQKLWSSTSEGRPDVSTLVFGTAVTGVFLAIALFPLKRQQVQDECMNLPGNLKDMRALYDDDIQTTLDTYNSYYSAQESCEDAVARRAKGYLVLQESYHNLVTDKFLSHWSESFHFGDRYTHETLGESLRRAEYFLCMRLGMQSEITETREGQYFTMVSSSSAELKDMAGDLWTYNRPMRALEINCGVGGSMRNMSRFSGCSIVGISSSPYHIAVGTALNYASGLGFQLDILQGDAQQLCNSALSEDCIAAGFDCVYSFSTAQSPNRRELFKACSRVLPPTGRFAAYDWALTDLYNPRDAYHVKLKRGIEKGCGLVSLHHFSHVLLSLEKSGFDVLEARDLCAGGSSPTHLAWQMELKESVLNLNSIDFHRTSWGRFLTIQVQIVLEAMRILPRGGADVSALLDQAAHDLFEAGRLGIFTPCYFFLARKRAG